MGSEVSYTSLADICCDVSYGYTESATSEAVGPKFLRITDIQGGTLDWNKVPYCPATDANTKKYALEIGDIVIARTGNSTGENTQLSTEPPPAVFASYLIRFRPDASRVNPFFVGYQLRSERFRQYVLAVRSGSAQPGANAKQLGAFTVELIDRALQDEAVEILRALDERITLLRETNATLEAIAQALFKSWFVDFDPVRAKAEGRQPEGMDATTAALFPDSFEESELGLVPKGWAEVRLGQLCTFQKGCSYKGDGLSDDQGAYMFNLGCFNAPRVYAFERVKRYTGEFKDKHRVTAGDLIIANTDMTQHRAILGRPLVIPEGMNPGFVSHHVFKVVINQGYGVGIKPFLFFCFLQPSFRERAVGYATGTTVLALPRDALEQHLIYLPSYELLKVFAECCDPIFAAIKSNELQAQTLTQLRDTLLPRLISGQLRLPEAEATVEEVL
ncbi:restriction endonuclease subunit S [Halopseudomonas yangmingensis]|uniref:Type I restriction enzyme, S subunit n=1 Tax=Halopseudomonas yangmingensis TaxID=1720063 RepID=A0A1I4SQI9_9GAMM|nr:restriction endonuclease subunit S [Halopseudomonas yangmingensis]SFM66756.1 type I restriction enzyme, S subunit [Halopseudomonas yangmingensis]